MSDHAPGERAAKQPSARDVGPADQKAPDAEPSQQEHHNPETEEDTASGGAPDQ
jgi:hypothetical protein